MKSNNKSPFINLYKPFEPIHYILFGLFVLSTLILIYWRVSLGELTPSWILILILLIINNFLIISIIFAQYITYKLFKDKEDIISTKFSSGFKILIISGFLELVWGIMNKILVNIYLPTIGEDYGGQKYSEYSFIISNVSIVISIILVLLMLYGFIQIYHGFKTMNEQ